MWGMLLRFLTPRVSLLTSTHFVIDSCASFLTPLLPLLMQKLDLNLTLVGGLIALSSLSSSLAQPLFGMWADRLHRPWLVVAGPIVAASFLCSVGLAPSYGWLVACIMLGGVGVAAFHPQAAALASTLLPRRGLAMSVFVTGGTIGFSVGPLIAVAIVSSLGLHNTWIWGLTGILISIPLLIWFRRIPPRTEPMPQRARWSELRPVAGHVRDLYLTTVCRYATSYGFMVFLPIFLTHHGRSFEFGGLAVSAYLTTGAIGAFIGGWLSDRVGGRTVVLWSLAGSLPFFLAFIFVPVSVALPVLLVGHLILQLSLPVMVVMGQEIAPRHASTMASLLMGGAWGIGLLLMGPVGALADARGIETALGVLASILVVGLLLALRLPDTRAVDAGAVGSTDQVEEVL